MAIKVSYVVKESVGNLRRNLLMTAAALITVTISLALAGASLLFRNGIDNAYIQFKNGFDITVMMKADASQEQIDGIGTELRSNPQIDQKAKKPRFVSKEESFAEIQRMFQNAPETLSAFRGVEDAPAQWRFKPVDAEQLAVLTPLLGLLPERARRLVRAHAGDQALKERAPLLLTRKAAKPRLRQRLCPSPSHEGTPWRWWSTKRGGSSDSTGDRERPALTMRAALSPGAP